MQHYVLLYQKLMLLRVGSLRLYLSSMNEELLPGIPVVNETRWARFLASVRDLLNLGDDPSQGEEIVMVIPPNAPSPNSVTISPSGTSMLAAPVEGQPAPVSVLTIPKVVNAKLKPLVPAPPPGIDERNSMNTRTASYNGEDPFYNFLRTKFAGMYDTGQPDLPEAAAMGLAGLGGVYLGGQAASYGAASSAKSQLAPWLEGIDQFTGSGAMRGIASDAMADAAATHKLRKPPTPWFWGRDKAILEGAESMERQLAHNITNTRRLPLKVLGGGVGALGVAYLLNAYAKSKAEQAAMAQQGY